MSWKEGSFLKVAVVVLIILNIGLIANQWFGHKPPKMGNKNPPAQLVDQVGFTNEQITKFDHLRKSHSESIKDLKNEIAELRKSFFGLLKEENSKEFETIKIKLGKLQEQEMQALYEHFKEVRALCDTEEQKDKFDKVIGNSIPGQNDRPPRHFDRKGPRNRPPPPH